MDRKLSSVIFSLAAVLVGFLLVVYIGWSVNESLQLDATAICRVVFVVFG